MLFWVTHYHNFFCFFVVVVVVGIKQNTKGEFPPKHTHIQKG